jgi:hypothetical protein
VQVVNTVIYFVTGIISTPIDVGQNINKKHKLTQDHKKINDQRFYIPTTYSAESLGGLRTTTNEHCNHKCEFNVHRSVHCKNIPIYIQQDATLHSLFYMATALHVSGGTTTHHQERKQLYLQHLVFVTTLLLPTTTVEVLELVKPVPTFIRCNVTQFILTGNCSTCFGWHIHPSSGAHTTASTATTGETSSNCSTIAADSSNGVTNTRRCRYSRMRS